MLAVWTYLCQIWLVGVRHVTSRHVTSRHVTSRHVESHAIFYKPVFGIALKYTATLVNMPSSSTATDFRENEIYA